MAPGPLLGDRSLTDCAGAGAVAVAIILLLGERQNKLALLSWSCSDACGDITRRWRRGVDRRSSTSGQSPSGQRTGLPADDAASSSPDGVGLRGWRWPG